MTLILFRFTLVHIDHLQVLVGQEPVFNELDLISTSWAEELRSDVLHQDRLLGL